MIAATMGNSATPVAAYIRAVSESTYRLAEEDTKLGRTVKHSLSILEDAAAKYSLEGISLSFNGGKDCTVLLHLWAAVCYRIAGAAAKPISALHILHDDAFPEITDFVNDCTRRYGLNLVEAEGTIKSGLAKILELSPQIKAVLIGARDTDPYYEHMPVYVMTDKDWPSVMRVHPILSWDYSDVWDFLRALDVPYCELYDRGYTSLGHRGNTQPNPELRNTDSPGGYNPAWMLSSASSERCGRYVNSNQ